jgi:MinD-like ATPase involved in chromosome partitioning or flagellar assembly
VQPDRFRKAVAALSRRFDIVLIDTAGVLNDLSLAALEEANMVLWITSSDFSSINNSLIGLETMGQLSYPESRIRLMLNVTSADDGVRPAKIESVLGRQFFWSVPYDRQVRMGGQIRGIDFHAGVPRIESIIELAQALIGGTAMKATPSSRRAPYVFEEER